MSIKIPYHRIYRPFIIEDQHQEDFFSEYIFDKDYAINPGLYIRNFLMTQKDLIELFEYIEPSDKNLCTYSLKIYKLYIYICMQIEANFKAILNENIISLKKREYNINTYSIINHTHHLNKYSVIYPIWEGENNKFIPFANWPEYKLIWYQDYNDIKHNASTNLGKANLKNLLEAFAAWVVVLSSQFGKNDFQPGLTLLGEENYYYEGETGIGDYLIINFPTNWENNEKYSFNWEELRNTPNKFQKFDYNQLKNSICH